MADDNLNKQTSSQAVTTIIDSFLKVEKKPKRKYTRRKKKEEALSAMPPPLPSVPEEEKKNGVWLTTLANLVLLVAIFTIIFAAHRAIQTSKQTSIPAPTVAVQAPETIIAEEVKEEPKQEPAKEEKKEEPVVKKAEKKSKYYPDPYTSGGPLDLDRHAPATSRVEQPVLNDGYTNYRNPWNAGGGLDLDNESTRQEYRKKNYISSTESDSQ